MTVDDPLHRRKMSRPIRVSERSGYELGGWARASANLTAWAAAPDARMTPPSSPSTVVVPGPHLMPALLGSRDAHLRAIEGAFPDTDISVRGNEVRITGPESGRVARLFEELVLVLQRGEPLDTTVVGRSISMVNADERPSAVLTD
ncbi:MAG: hypothetical protein RLZ86_1475, partial [Actinomycetota bacterium]